MKGKSYDRGIRAHKLCLEVFFRLTWKAFLAWYESQEKRIPEEPVLRKIVNCVRMVENKENARDSVRKMEAELTELMSLFGFFKSENQARSKLFTSCHGLFPFTVFEGRENRELEVASIQHRNNATSLFCHGQAELCSFLTCLSRRHAATGTNTPR